MKCVISVLGKDRSGVVAAIATTLADCGANIDDISQTILGEGRMFSMTMMVTLDPAVADFNTVQERLAADGERLSMQVLIQREDVFQAMYEIENAASIPHALGPRWGRIAATDACRRAIAPRRCRRPKFLLRAFLIVADVHRQRLRRR